MTRFAVISSVSFALAATHPGTAAGQEAFFDPFTVLDRGFWFRSHGWSNGPWMNCDWSRDAVEVTEGTLRLHLREGASGLICGEIQSRAEYGYGTYEIRMRTGEGSGLNAAFFTYIGPVHDRAHHEIDIEVLLRDTDAVTFNTFVVGDPLSGGEAPVQGGSDSGFQTYAFTWEPDQITWFVNGRAVHRTDPGAPIPEAPQKIYASLWSSDTFIDWMGPFDATALPSVMKVDWIAFTPLGEPCHFEGSILC